MTRAALERAQVHLSGGRIPYEQFLSLDLENNHVEWVDGQAVPMPPISGGHQDVALFLLQLLGTFVQEKKLGELKFDPFQMKTGVDLPGRAPDILFVSNAHKKRLKRTFLQGPADLVVEIISPDSRGVDRGEKYYEYEQGGVPEYWLIDPDRRQAEFYLRDKHGIYQLATLDDQGHFHSRVISGLWIDPAWLWKSPMPPVLSIIKKWGLF